MGAPRSRGFVLAGGESSRMGRDKALLPYGNSTLVEHVAAQAAAAAGSAALIGRPERYRGLGYPVFEDLVPARGPLGGVVTALSATDAPWNLIVACDMPGVTAEFLSMLIEAAVRSGGDCLVPVSPSGRLEPLCAVYHRDALGRLKGALDRNLLALGEAVRGPRLATWPAAEAGFFRNLNVPQDLEHDR
ncbi:MAG: molybdenum cofactor guanylyltransferase [Acidobacteriota bacterium]